MAELFDYPIRVEPSGQVLHRTLKSPFGDGYAQVAPDGVNTRLDSWNLSARGLKGEPAPGACVAPGQPVQAIMDFIDARKGAEAFEWTAPNGTTALWLCDGYSITKDTPGARGMLTITFTFYRTYFP